MVQIWTKNIDAELGILEVSLRYYEKNHSAEVRRAVLKALCDDWLDNKTNGAQFSFGGGTFQRAIDILEDEMAFHCIKDKNHKTTNIILDIARIKSLLLIKKFGQFTADGNNNSKIADIEVPYTIWENIFEQEVEVAFDGWLKKSNLASSALLEPSIHSYLIMKEAIKKINSYVATSMFDFIIKHGQESFQLEEHIAKELANAAFRMTKKNPRVPFKLLIEYKGMTDYDFNFGILVIPQMARTIIAKYFAKWAKVVFNYDVSTEEQDKVVALQLDLLSPSTKQYYHIFFDSLSRYIKIYVSAKKDLTSNMPG